VAAIHDAARTGDVEKAKALLTADPALAGAVAGVVENGPLHLAAAAGHEAMVGLLIQAGADVNARVYNRFTPLHLAKNGKVAKLLLKAEASVDLLDAWGLTPLQRAANEDRLDVVEVILAAGHKLDLWTAVRLGNREDVKRTLKEDPAAAKARPAGKGEVRRRPALAVAAGQRDRELVRLLLDAGADANDTTPVLASDEIPVLFDAVVGGDNEVVDLLLRRGARVSGWGTHDPLAYAREHASPEIVALLERAAKEQAEKPKTGKGKGDR
jgi:ankyrin repeat protein